MNLTVFYFHGVIESLINNGLFISYQALFVSFVLFIFSKYLNNQYLEKTFSIFGLVRLFLGFSLVYSLLNYLFALLYFLKFFNEKSNLMYGLWANRTIFNNLDFISINFFCKFKIQAAYFDLVFDIIGLVFLILAYFIGFISLLTVDSKFYFKKIKFWGIIHFLCIVITFYVFTNNIFFFFFFYELLLIPSFFFVYFVSSYRRSTQASLFFLIWTQLGSFLVLLAFVYMLQVAGKTNINELKMFNWTDSEFFVIYMLLFVGFGFKIPIYPTHYWLTKTHVEAPTGFSIFLSGFLVKSAVYGFYKISNVMGNNFFSILPSVICILGVLDSSIKMWHQTDLKKLVAYGTIQEMNLIYLAFVFGDGFFIIGGVLFCITHGFLSGLFFYFVDCIQRRYSTRSIYELNGIIHDTPNLAYFICVGVFLYAGLPGTLKFVCEVYIFAGLFDVYPFSVFILILGANFLGILGFSKCWFNAIFGVYRNYYFFVINDLTFKEVSLMSLIIIFLFLFQISLNILI